MLTTIFQSLMNHLTPLDMPLFLADCVPEVTPFPYVTAEVKPALSGQDGGALILTIWSCSESANAERLTKADQLLALLPARGIRLATGDGVLLLRLKSPAVCVQQDAARGLQTVWQLTHIPSV